MVGLFLGPIFPLILNQCGNLVPGYLLSGAIGWIVSIGVTGIALIPFMAGAFSDKYGVVAIQPLCVQTDWLSRLRGWSADTTYRLIALMCVLVLIWTYINLDHWRSVRHVIEPEVLTVAWMQKGSGMSMLQWFSWRAMSKRDHRHVRMSNLYDIVS